MDLHLLAGFGLSDFGTLLLFGSFWVIAISACRLVLGDLSAKRELLKGFACRDLADTVDASTQTPRQLGRPRLLR